MEAVQHPGDIEHHIMRDLGFGVTPAGEAMHGTGVVVPEMWVPGTTAIRTSILAAWADVVAGHLAIDLFDPGVPVTLDLDVHLHRPAPESAPRSGWPDASPSRVGRSRC